MRSIIVSFCLFLLCTGVWAQNMDAQNRAITLKVLDKKERPVRNIVVQSVNTGKAGMTDRSGLFVFEDMADDDKISVMMKKNGQIVIPVTGMDLIVVKTISSNLYSYEKNGEVRTTKIERPFATDGNTILDVPAILQQRSYTSLIELLRVNAAGLNITSELSPSSNTAVSMGRGPTSITSGTQPLVVLDGIPFSLSEANFSVNVYTIKTIEINKNGTGYGVRGSNGVIVIKTQ